MKIFLALIAKQRMKVNSLKSDSLKMKVQQFLVKCRKSLKLPMEKKQNTNIRWFSAFFMTILKTNISTVLLFIHI